MIFTDKEFQVLSLRECFIKISGADCFRLARDCECTCVKLSKYKNHCIFNLRCKKQGVVPKGLRVPCYVKSERGQRNAEKASQSFVRELLRLVERKKRDLLDDKRWMEIGLERLLGQEIK